MSLALGGRDWNLRPVRLLETSESEPFRTDSVGDSPLAAQAPGRACAPAQAGTHTHVTVLALPGGSVMFIESEIIIWTVTLVRRRWAAAAVVNRGPAVSLQSVVQRLGVKFFKLSRPAPAACGRGGERV